MRVLKIVFLKIEGVWFKEVPLYSLSQWGDGYFKCVRSLSSRHQRDQGSIIKTLSQASFSNIPSGTNLQALTNSYNNLHNGPSSQRTHLMPPDANSHINGSDKNNGVSNKGVGDPGMLEFVKVDVDNNMVNISREFSWSNIKSLMYE